MTPKACLNGQVEGVYWQSLDRTVFSNGTIRYSGTGVEEQAIVLYATLGGGGAVTPLPHIQAICIHDVLLH